MEGTIKIRNLRTSLPIGIDAWGRPNKQQPVIISASLKRDIRLAARDDDCSQTTSYSDVAKALLAAHESKVAPGKESTALEQAHESIHAMRAKFGGTELSIETVCPKGLVRFEGGYALRSISREAEPDAIEALDVFIDLKLACIIGVNSHEREHKQNVVINMQLRRDPKFGSKNSASANSSNNGPISSFPIREMVRSSVLKNIIETTEQSTFQTVEALALRLVSVPLLFGMCWDKATLQVEKPSAIAIADGSGVELEITRDEWLRYQGVQE